MQNKDYREEAAARRRKISAEGRDISIPEIVNLERRKACEKNLELFLPTYFPETFFLEFSKDQREVIKTIETCIYSGGSYADALPRGDGKTSISIGSIIFAVLGGYRRYIALIGATTRATQNRVLYSMRLEFMTNPRLLEDYPKAVAPFFALQGQTKRCPGQTYEGELTRIQVTTPKIVMPCIPGSLCSESAIEAYGLTAEDLRGMQHKISSGETLRPDFALLDDPQTDESAASLEQSAKRVAIVKGTVLGLAGPKKRIAAVMPCTIIKKGDMADQLLDHDLNPEWQGKKGKMVEAWADKHDDLWLGKYAELRREGLAAGDGGAEGTEFYKQHREEMDAGCIVSWDERYNEDEISAIQHAYNLLLDLGEAVFNSEYQNDPKEDVGADILLSSKEIIQKLNKLKRYQIPQGCSRVATHIDIGGKVLHYTTVAAGRGFTGAIIDYGTAKVPQVKGDAGGVEAAIVVALNELVNDLATREYSDESGQVLTTGIILVDAGWKTTAIFDFCRAHKHKAILNPAMGAKLGAGVQLKVKKGGKCMGIGDHWIMTPPSSGNIRTRLVSFDSRYWKTFLFERLRIPIGGVGSQSLWGNRPQRHKEYADHLTAETMQRLTAKDGAVYDIWKPKPGDPPNHWFDTTVGALVGLGILGIKLAHEKPRAAKRKRIKPKGINKSNYQGIRTRY